MKKFNNEDGNRYPTFSFCFKGARFHWFHDLEIFDSYGLNATQYDRLIKGTSAERYERNDNFRSYVKTPVFSSSSKDADFETFYLQMTDFVSSLHFATETTKHDTLISNSSGWNSTKEPAMHISHQTADQICFSRKSTDDPDSIRLHDLITINSSVIRLYNETQMDVFVHYPNQVISSLGKAKYSDSFSHLQSILNGTDPKTLEFKLTECKGIKKRHDSNEKCSLDIKNYDKYLQQKMAETLEKQIGCVPIYLKSSLSNGTALEVCYSPDELKKAHQILKGMKNNFANYEKPCNEMLVLSIDSINNNPFPVPDDISMKFIYTEKTFEEIEYVKAIGFENWLSNVGGFVGIFLGYSIMQFPEFLLLLATVFNRKRLDFLASRIFLYYVHF